MEADKTQVAVDIFNRNAKAYSEKFGDVSLYHDGFDIFCQNLAPHAKVLELATGPGNITKYILQKRADLQWLATDLAPQMLELAKTGCPSITTQLLDARNINQFNQDFDGIMCGFCLPYLSRQEALQFIADAYRALIPHGILYLSTMEDRHENSGWRTGSSGEQMYMYYHESNYLEEAIRKNGFDLVDLHRKFYTSGQEKITDLIIIAKKQG